MIPRLLTLAATAFGSAPRWLALATAALVSLASHGTAYHLGGAHEFRAGFAAGQAATTARHRAATDRRTARQIEDRLNAETAPSPADAGPDGLRCGPSTRDCPR